MDGLEHEADEFDGYLHCEPRVVIDARAWSPVMLEGDVWWSMDAACEEQSVHGSGGEHIPGLPGSTAPAEAPIEHEETLCGVSNWFEPGCISASADVEILFLATNMAEVVGETVELVLALEVFDRICQTVNLRPYEPDPPIGPTSVIVHETYQYCVTGRDRDDDDIRFTMWAPGPDLVSPYLPSGSVWCPSVTFGYGAPDICLLVFVTDVHGLESDFSDCLSVDATFGTPQNVPPRAPSAPDGPDVLDIGQSGWFATTVQDDDADLVIVTYDWGDGTTTETDLMASGTEVSASHQWDAAGVFCVRARGTDEHGAPGHWSPCADVEVALGPDAFEPDGSFVEHSAMGLAATQQTQERTLAPAGDNDYVKFYATAGNRVNFFSTGDTDTRATMYDPAQVVVASDEDSGDGNNFEISYEVETDGYHYIRVEGVSADIEGPYALHGDFDAPPIACFTHSLEGMVLTVDASCSSDVDGDPVTYEWTWGDGTTTQGGPVAVHVYENRGRIGHGIGRYDVSLEVSDDLGAHRTSIALPVGPSDYALAKHFAPVFYHNTRYFAEPCSVILDEIMRFDFDGDWVGGNNWENADDDGPDEHKAYVYFSVHETRSDYYIGYAVFHPRDWTSCSDTAGSFFEHENDMETVLVRVDKDLTTYGTFVAALTMAHNSINAYWNHWQQPGIVDGAARQPHEFWDLATFWSGDGGHHIELGIETEGHGIMHKQHPDIWDNGADTFVGGDGNVYFPTGSAEVPGEGAGGDRGNDDHVGYELIGLQSLWDRRHDYGSTQPYATYGVFYGDDGAPNHQAGAPWGIEDWCYEGDPVQGSENCPNDDLNEAWVNREQSLWSELPHVLFDQYLTMPGSDSDEYVHRSLGGHFESFHEYRRETVTYRWSHPGASSLILEFDNIQTSADAGDYLQYRVAPSGSWVNAPQTGGHGSACLYGDRVEVRLVSDGDGVRDWGFYLRNIQWDPAGC